ncbi:MAG: hypothetical protein KBT03_01260 [Bacteroidales bacterium]|nr:hypothetical protein [Candidatus Scybalousia scybalohippi]
MRLEEFLDRMVLVKERDLYLYEFDSFDDINDQIEECNAVSRDENEYICKLASEQRMKPSAYLNKKLAFAEVDRYIIGERSVYIFLRFSEDKK